MIVLNSMTQHSLSKRLSSQFIYLFFGGLDQIWATNCVHANTQTLSQINVNILEVLVSFSIFLFSVVGDFCITISEAK